MDGTQLINNDTEKDDFATLVIGVGSGDVRDNSLNGGVGENGYRHSLCLLRTMSE